MSETENLRDDARRTAEDATASLSQLKDDAGRVARSAADAGRAGLESLKGKISDGHDAVKAKLTEGGDAVRAKIADGREAIREKISDGQAAVQDAAERAKTKGNALVSDLSARIEQNPLQAIAIAAGVGVAVGLLLRR